MSSSEENAGATIAWPRAILTAAIIVAVGVAACVYLPNTVLTRFHSVHRHQQVAIATTIFFVALIALAWGLRVAQRRKLL